MLKRVTKFLHLYYPQLAIFLLVAAIAATNYKTGTYLTGWDNLHPELNFTTNVKRSIFAVWQEYQGLGLLGGMGHVADLPRQLLLWVLATVLPQNSLRYFWTFLMLFAGGLGTCALAIKIFSPRESARPTALLAGLFYILNLATIQTFWTPFETFTTHFGFLPWILWATVNYFQKPSLTNLALLSVISLAATPGYYVPTLFVVTCLTIGILLAGLAAFAPNKQTLAKIAKITVAFFATNAFWLLPFAYFTAVNTGVVVNNKINQMATETILQENREFGTLPDVALLKGFWFAKTDLTHERNFDWLMGPWHEHIENPAAAAIGYIFFAAVLAGLVLCLRSRKPLPIAAASIFLFSLTMLALATPPFSWVGEAFRSIPLFSQAFRFPFTKFSILASLSYALLFAVTIQWAAAFIKKRHLLITYHLLLIAFLAIYTLPVFRGHFFYEKERRPIPREYFQLFEFFEKQPAGRIANFPQHTFWGWNYYSWGYTGSGFLWYGIGQPIADRAFDPWNHKNENYYWEISYALYSRNQALFEKTLEKYNISWLLVDKNVINPTAPRALFLDELHQLLVQSNEVELVETFGNVDVYRVRLDVPVNNFVWLANNLPVVSPTYRWTSLDQAFVDYGHYTSTNEKSIYYPFRSLFTGRRQEREFELEDKDGAFVLKHKLPGNIAGYNLQVPKEALLSVDPKNLADVARVEVDVQTTQEGITVTIPKVGGYYAADLDATNASATCQDTQKTQAGTLIVSSAGTFCRVSFDLPTLDHKLAYLITAEAANSQGQSLTLWFENKDNRKADIETNLPKTNKLATYYFVQPPMAEGGLGYALHLDSKSTGPTKSVNEIGRIRIFQFPFKLLTGTKLVGKAENTPTSTYSAAQVQHPNQSLYKVTVAPSAQKQVLVLSQSFDRGWATDKNLPRVFVDNWANGWIIEPHEQPVTITLFYLPQYLEYAGFAILLVGLAVTARLALHSRGGIQN